MCAVDLKLLFETGSALVVDANNVAFLAKLLKDAIVIDSDAAASLWGWG